VRSVIGLCLALLREGAGATTGSGTSRSLLAVAFSLDVPLGHVPAQQDRKIQMLVELPPVPSPRQSHARLNRMRLQASVSGRVGVGCCDANVSEHYRRPIPRSDRCSTGASPRGAGCCPVRVARGFIGREILARTGPIPPARLKWETAMRLYGSDATSRRLIQRMLDHVPD